MGKTLGNEQGNVQHREERKMETVSGKSQTSSTTVGSRSTMIALKSEIVSVNDL